MSPRCDLIVWFRNDNRVAGFQLCYDKDVVEHALTWVEDQGFNHMRIDTGGGMLAHGRGTPLLVPNGLFDPHRLLELFHAECALVPVEFVQLVTAKLEQLVEAEQETS